MENERTKIIKLLSKGEIDTDEAVQLLNALSPKPGMDLEGASERFHEAFLKVEPELNSLSKEVLGAVASLLDDVSRSLK